MMRAASPCFIPWARPVARARLKPARQCGCFSAMRRLLKCWSTAAFTGMSNSSARTILHGLPCAPAKGVEKKNGNTALSNGIQSVRGMNDILPAQSASWQYVEAVIREVLDGYGYGEIRLPVVEKTALFSRSIGEVTDIV